MAEKYSDDNPYDYSKCDFEIILKKKKTFSFSKRYIYFNKQELVICRDPYQNQPRKIVYLDPFCYITWIIDKKKQNKKFEERTIGFKIFNEQNEKQVELYGDKLAFKDLRKYFSKYLFETNLMDDYEIIEKIGKGKYAKVYKIEDKLTKKTYAAKYLDKQKMNSIEFGRESLLNELSILRTLNHPNCIQYIRSYREEKGYFIVTALLNPKKTLQDELQKFKNPTFGFPLVKSIIKQLLEGCKYFHSLGIMHRDLKPQNIMFADNNTTTMNQLKIIDFGLAQFTSAKKYMYVHVGTPGYVAPEILANESDNHTYTEQCDIFSIGVIFHILLTGRTVFQGNKFHEVLKLNKRAIINLQGQRYNEMNQDAYNLLKLMLQQNPRLRITASEALKHNYFQEDVGVIIQRNNSVHNLDITNEEISPVIKYRKKHSLQFFGRYQQQNNSLTQEQQYRIIQQLKSPENLKYDQEGQQKFLLYKITHQLIQIIYNRQQEGFDLENPFSSTSSPLRFNLQKSRLNSVDSFQGYGNTQSPIKKEIGSYGSIDQQNLGVMFKQQTPKRKSLDASPNKKYSISSNKKNYEQIEVFKEEEEYKYQQFRDSTVSQDQVQKISEFQGSDESKKTKNSTFKNSNENVNNNKNNNEEEDEDEGNVNDIGNEKNNNYTLKQTPPKVEDSEQIDKFQFLGTTQKAKNTSNYFKQTEEDDNQQKKMGQQVLQQRQLSEQLSQKKFSDLDDQNKIPIKSSQSEQINYTSSQIKKNSNDKIQAQNVLRNYSDSISPQKQFDKSSGSTPILKQKQQQQQQQQQQDLKQQIQGLREKKEDRYSKDILPLVEYFPETIIQLFLSKQDQNQKAIRLLGLFLLFGQEKYIKNDNRTQIERRFEHIKKNNIHDNWFIDMLKLMLQNQIDLLNLNIRLEKGINEMR